MKNKIDPSRTYNKISPAESFFPMNNNEIQTPINRFLVSQMTQKKMKEYPKKRENGEKRRRKKKKQQQRSLKELEDHAGMQSHIN